MQQGCEHSYVMPQEGFIRIDKVLIVVGVSKSTIYKMMNEGRFPRQFVISDGIKGHRVEEVREWLILGRDQKVL